MSALDDLRKKNEEIKKDIHNEKVTNSAPATRTGPEEMQSALAQLGQNKDLMAMYGDSADLGSENIGGESLPLLKVHSSGKSLGDTLLNGEEPHNGYFFHKKTQQEFKEVLCHVLTISRGFRADGIEGKKDVFNQVLGGVVINDGQFLPFLMYFTGTKLQNLWDFGKEASQYTKMKPVGIPMFALTVKLTTEKVIEGAKNWFVIKFNISRDVEGNPEIVTNKEEFVLLRNNVSKVQEMIDRLIAKKATEDTAQIVTEDPENIPDVTVADDRPDIVIPDEMPF